MANKDIRDAIDANIEAILVAQGFNFEDSSSDMQQESVPLVSMVPRSLDSDSVYGLRPGTGEVENDIIINFDAATPAVGRSKRNDYFSRVVENLTVNALNVGAVLGAGKNVSNVIHEKAFIEIQGAKHTMTIPVTVKYGEV